VKESLLEKTRSWKNSWAARNTNPEVIERG
jgi:hypothetical protein